MRWPRRLWLPAICAVLLTGGDPVGAAVIQVINRDGGNEGFNDPTPATPVGGNTGVTLGQQRLIAFNHAANVWAEMLDSNVTIRVGATFDPLDCDNTSVVLGFAGPNNPQINFVGVPRPDTFYVDALADKLAGVDLCPPRDSGCGDGDDISASFNSLLGNGCTFPAEWYMGLDGQPPFDDPDLVTTVLHELGHGLGFITLLDAQGRKFNGDDDAFMLQLEDHRTGKLFPEMTNAERRAASIAGPDLHWVGPRVVAASGSLAAGVGANGHVQIWAPAVFQDGGSVSHWSVACSPNELMEPFDTGPSSDVGLALEALQDMGWANAPSDTQTPTPSRTPTVTRTRTATTRPTRTQGPTNTPSRTASATRTATRTRTVGSPTPTKMPIDGCAGDCDADNVVRVDELVTGVNIALGELPVAACERLDFDRDDRVSIDELVAAVGHALNGCPATPQPSATATLPPDATPRPSRTALDVATATATASPPGVP